MFAPSPFSRTASAARARRSCRPEFECLEDRCVPAVYNVNTLLDPSIAAGVNNATGVINGTTNTVSLRSAIQAANNTPGGNTINLRVSGTYRITLAPTGNETDNQAGEFAILPEGNLTIVNRARRGYGQSGQVRVDGSGLSRVFDINPGNTDNAATHFTVTMQGFTIEDGRAFDATGADPDGAVATGGGIRDQGNQSLTLKNMVLTGNSATADGGGVSMENSVDTAWTLTLTNTTVRYNAAGDAGGGVETDGSGHVVITGSTIAGNMCVNQGAGIWLDAIGNDSATLSVMTSLVRANMALNGPTGGIGNAGNGAVTIVASTVVSNFSGGTTTGGGGFGDQNGLGTLTVLNSTFVGNTSTEGGAGIQESGPSTTINDSTITGNLTLHEGGGLDITSAAFTLNNTIVALNLSNAGGMNFAGVNPDVVGAVTTGNGNFIGIGGPGLTGITNGTNDNFIGTAAAPLNPLLGGLRNNGGPTPTELPLLGSSVIDAGDNAVIPAGTTTDQRGFTRIVNGTVDIGAVEVQRHDHHDERGQGGGGFFLGFGPLGFGPLGFGPLF